MMDSRNRSSFAGGKPTTGEKFIRTAERCFPKDPGGKDMWEDED